MPNRRTLLRASLGVLATASIAGRARANRKGVWCPIERLSEMALPTLMKKVANHAMAKMDSRA